MSEVIEILTPITTVDVIEGTNEVTVVNEITGLPQLQSVEVMVINELSQSVLVVRDVEVQTVSVKSIISADLDMVYRETPTGPINGVNQIFALLGEYITGTTMLFLNGLLEVDYEEIGFGEVKILLPPLEGDIIKVSYMRP